jgi:hypothetical protein
MSVFDHPNPDGFLCPVCKTGKDAPVVLVPVSWTEVDGICEVRQAHEKCLDLMKESNAP